MEELLWFSANMMSDNPSQLFNFTSEGFTKTLYLLVKSYDKQLSPSVWRCVIWNFRVMAVGMEN